jgi:hypothetical protein
MGYKFLDMTHPGSEDFLRRHNTASGILISILSLYILLQLLLFLPKTPGL